MKNTSVMLAMASVTSLLSLGFAGCATTTKDTGVDPELTCGDRTVTVFQSIGFLAVYPEYIDVCAGQSININAVPRGRGLRTSPAEGNPGMDGWLSAGAEGGGSVVITVPGDATPGVYKYAIAVNEVGMLDPRLRVIRR